MRYERVLLYTVLALSLVLGIFIHKNADLIFVQLGNFYYKQNNIEKAQNFYEKAFSLGNKNSDVREIYVNSIINSPLDTEAQEKLVKFAEGEKQDSASVKAKYFLYDLMREIHAKYPLNYIKQAPYNGKIVRWNRFPITYSFQNQSSAPPEYIEEINNAFSEWEKAGRLMFTQAVGNADIKINFIKPNQKISKFEYGKKYIVAYTVPQISGNILENMCINFYLQDPEGKNYTRTQIYNTALHEIFHALGFMGHSFDAENIMYLSKDSVKFQKDVRSTLTGADFSTLKLLYATRPDITNSTELKSEYVPYVILGDNEDIALSKTKEAKNYINHAPALPGGYIDLAESYAAEKRYSDAIRNLEKALRLADTDDVKYIVYYNLAVAYSYISNSGMALDYLEKAGEIKNDEELHVLKAEILKKTGDIANTKKEYAYLIKINPDNPDYAIRLANIYIQEYDYLKARKILKTFLKNHPQYKKDKSFSPYGILLIL